MVVIALGPIISCWKTHILHKYESVGKLALIARFWEGTQAVFQRSLLAGDARGQYWTSGWWYSHPELRVKALEAFAVAGGFGEGIQAVLSVAFEVVGSRGQQWVIE